MDPTLRAVVEQLDLEDLGGDTFRGASRDTGTRSVFGGQVIAQALVAAERTAGGRVPHSLHAYFLLPGDFAAPIDFQVERLRDGGSFSARRVQAIQRGRVLLSSIASFQVPEVGLEHAAPIPDVPPPETLPPAAELRERWLAQAAEAGALHPRVGRLLRAPRAFDFRAVDPQDPVRPSPAEPRHSYWFRAVDRLPDDPALHRHLLAYASDTALVGTVLRPHARSWADLLVASLDHALWFHRPARVDEWLLYATDSPTAQSARGLARGLVYDRAGRLVASTAQEALVRETRRHP